jgi:hypothetical protein
MSLNNGGDEITLFDAGNVELVPNCTAMRR